MAASCERISLDAASVGVMTLALQHSGVNMVTEYHQSRTSLAKVLRNFATLGAATARQ